MNIFKRIASWFNRKKDDREVVYSGPLPGPAPEPKVVVVDVPKAQPIYDVTPNLKPVDNPIVVRGNYHIRFTTTGPLAGLFTVMETQQSFNSLKAAEDHVDAFMARDTQLNSATTGRAEAYSSLQPGEIDVEDVDADDFLFYAAQYPILNKASPTGRFLGPWDKVSAALNWLQCQGGEPTAKLAAAFPAPNSQFMAHFKYQQPEGANSYTGRFRAAYDQNK